MNIFQQFFSGIFDAITKRLLSDATPFLLAEATAIAQKTINMVGILADASLDADEKKRLFNDELDGLKTLLEASKSEGSDLASEILTILTQSVGDDLLSVFGFHATQTPSAP